LKTNISHVAVVALVIVSSFAVAGLRAVAFLSESFAVVQGLGNDPISGCFKATGKTEVETGGIQNWTESIQNFVSLIHTNKTLKLINEKIVGADGPITDIAGIWSVLKNDTMSAHNRKVVLTVVNNLLATVQPGFTRIQQDTLGRCIINEAKSLGPSTLTMLNSFK
jgi:hypothetical protein